MKTSLLELLVCPTCMGELRIAQGEPGDEIDSGVLACAQCARRYPVIRGIPRFVPASNYADNFAIQWNLFRRTQLDSHSGVPISRQRFIDQTGWDADVLRGKLVLDVGCGAGRFAEIALALGARVVALDYSGAVDACRANLAHSSELDVIQGDIYALPLRRHAFPLVYCLGVLQHTPDVERAFKALPPVVAPAGALVVDLYLKNWALWFHPRMWLRPLTTRMSPDNLFRLVRRSAPSLLVCSRAAARVPGVGRYLKRLVPVADYTGVYPLSEQQLFEWAVLDTFDWFGPRYDQPQKGELVRRWFEEAGLVDIEVFRSHHLTGRGRVPSANARAARD